MENVVSYFEVEITGDVDAFCSKPIFSHDTGKLVGGFIPKKGNLLACSVANEPPLSLYISIKETLWFTPVQGKDGLIFMGVISENKISETSVPIKVEG